MASSYSDLLKDPRWQKRRLEVLEKAAFTCQDCGAKDKELHVHHLVYRKGCKPWEYSDDALLVVCMDCHKAMEVLRDKLLLLCRSRAMLGALEEVALIRSPVEIADYADPRGGWWYGAIMDGERQQSERIAGMVLADNALAHGEIADTYVLSSLAMADGFIDGLLSDSEEAAKARINLKNAGCPLYVKDVLKGVNYL